MQKGKVNESLKDLWDITKRPIHIHYGNPEQEKGQNTYLEETMAQMPQIWRNVYTITRHYL